MINIIEILIIYGLGVLDLYLNSKNEVLKLENKGLRDRIKRNQEWFEVDKKISCDLARVDERFKISREEFQKQCEEFQDQCGEYHKQCEEIDKKLGVKKDEESKNITR